MTMPTAIRELEKIEMVRQSGGSYKLDHAIPKTQKTILSANCATDRTVLRSKTDVERSERTP